jgi:CRISPR-associated exonuclease Cas4
MSHPEYTADELLPLSDIQHFLFCRRQWALIHVEQQWQDNVLTVEGKLLHRQVDDPCFNETRKGIITARAMPVASYHLGLYGICDVVEFVQRDEGIQLLGREGLFQPAPVEYKHGKEKQEPCDEVQLCAQAICLEEMLLYPIPNGYFYYGEIRHRVKIEFTDELRNLVIKMAAEMHNYFEKGYTPQVKPTKACNSCSLKDICLPELQKNTMSASKYIRMEIDSD